jgi:hypothetical protein
VAETAQQVQDVSLEAPTEAQDHLSDDKESGQEAAVVETAIDASTDQGAKHVTAGAQTAESEPPIPGDAGEEEEQEAVQRTQDQPQRQWRWPIQLTGDFQQALGRLWSPLAGKRDAALVLKEPQQSLASAAEEETAAGAKQTSRGLQDVLKAPAADDKVLHFSLHRSHRQLWVSSVEAPAAARVRLLPSEALQGGRGLATPVEFTVLKSKDAADDGSQSAVEQVPDAEQQHEVDEQMNPAVQPTDGQQQTHEADPVTETSPTEEASMPTRSDVDSGGAEELAEKEDAGAPASEEEPLQDASEQLLKAGSPSLELPALAADPDTTPAEPAEPQAGEAQALPVSVEDDKAPAGEPAAYAEVHPQPSAQVAVEHVEEPDSAEQQGAPEQAASEGAVVPEAEALKVAETALPEEVLALRVAKPEAVPSAAAAAPQSPTSAEGHRAASKSKHSWHSPALSARYGEMEDNEPRYKPRSPDADAGKKCPLHDFCA